MLAISVRSKQEGKDEASRMEANFCVATNDEFPEFSGSNLLDSIDFDDLFMGIHHSNNNNNNNNSDGLPDLEMDPELLAEFSLSGGEDESSSMSVENAAVSPNSFFDGNISYVLDGHDECANNNNGCNNDEAAAALLVEEDCTGTGNHHDGVMKSEKLELEIESKKCGSESSESVTLLINSSSSSIDKEKGHKKHRSSSNTKDGSNNNNNDNDHHDNGGNQGKRKTKVDWTPELHRRFVQAVEQLGVDKAVPSRILELMGIDCLTRHNIASHLQKYRSHRKHLLAREAEAASWSQKRQMYGVAMGGGNNKGGANISPWPHPPTIGFPPMTTTTMHHFRPLHVWGHPSIDPHARTTPAMWPKQVVPSLAAPLPPPSWAPHPHPPDPAFWHSSHHRRLPIATISPVLVPGIPPHHAMYKPDHGVSRPPLSQHRSTTPLDSHPTEESVDAALEDVLAKPWLPLPIGLKAPSMDSVLGELQRHGVSKIPPS